MTNNKIFYFYLNTKKHLFFIFLFLLVSIKFSEAQTVNNNIYISFYNAVLSGPGIEDALLLSSEFEYSYQLYAFAVSKKIASYKNSIDIEIEGQIVKHSGDQHHLEFNPVLVFRYSNFPWNHVLNTSFAFGEGLSYATKIPEIEQKHNENVAKFLNYLLFEFTFAMPETQQWSLIARVHHRSGAYGLFSGVTGASNAVGLGIKYKF